MKINIETLRQADHLISTLDRGALAQAIAALICEKDMVQKQLDEADRRAGAADRLREDALDSLIRREQWFANAKRDAGYPLNTSFDVVWAEALAALLRERDRNPKGGDLLGSVEDESPVTEGHSQ